jgi:hypothetical protein
MSDCKPSPIPIDATSKSAHEGEVDPSLKYREIIGALMYASVASRGDISYIVDMLHRYLDKPTRQLWSVAMKVLRCVSGTRDVDHNIPTQPLSK